MRLVNLGHNRWLFRIERAGYKRLKSLRGTPNKTPTERAQVLAAKVAKAEARRQARGRAA
jgi:hypothetical protein